MKSAGAQTLEAFVAVSLHLERGLWLQQPHIPIIHLHNGCLFIHYANGTGGKLGNKGRRKEKIALAFANILFISKHCGLQRAEPQSTPVPGNLLFHLSPVSFLGGKSLFFFSFSTVSFVEPSEQYNVEC